MKLVVVVLGLVIAGLGLYVAWTKVSQRLARRGEFRTQRFNGTGLPYVEELDRQRSEMDDRSLGGGAFATDPGELNVGTPPKPMVQSSR